MLNVNWYWISRYYFSVLSRKKISQIETVIEIYWMVTTFMVGWRGKFRGDIRAHLLIILAWELLIISHKSISFQLNSHEDRQNFSDFPWFIEIANRNISINSHRSVECPIKFMKNHTETSNRNKSEWRKRKRKTVCYPNLCKFEKLSPSKFNFGH